MHGPTLVAPVSTKKTPGTREVSTDIAVPNVLKQLTAATTFLPDLPTAAVFKLQAYVAPRDEASFSLLSDEWAEADGIHPFGEDAETQQVRFTLLNVHFLTFS